MLSYLKFKSSRSSKNIYKISCNTLIKNLFGMTRKTEHMNLANWINTFSKLKSFLRKNISNKYGKYESIYIPKYEIVNYSQSTIKCSFMFSVIKETFTFLMKLLV